MKYTNELNTITGWTVTIWIIVICFCLLQERIERTNEYHKELILQAKQAEFLQNRTYTKFKFSIPNSYIMDTVKVFCDSNSFRLYTYEEVRAAFMFKYSIPTHRVYFELDENDYTGYAKDTLIEGNSYKVIEKVHSGTSNKLIAF